MRLGVLMLEVVTGPLVLLSIVHVASGQYLLALGDLAIFGLIVVAIVVRRICLREQLR